MNTKQPKEFQKIFASISKNIKQKKQKCIIDTCDNDSINSHLLQQNGILNTISDNNHLIEIKPKDIFKWEKNIPPIEFKKISIKQALSLNLFCNKHDTTIFKKLETSPIDFSDKENQLLLSYRVVCAEIRKKEQNIETYRRLMNSKILNGYIDPNYFNISIKGNRDGINDLNIYKKEIDDEITYNKNDFEFINIKYPLIKVYCSAVFSVYETYKTPIEDSPLNFIFIHVIPYEKELNIIIGYNKKHSKKYIIDYINSWKNLSMLDLEKMLTNLFATKVENWGMSPSILDKISTDTLRKFIDYFSENSLNYLANQKVEFNLFENKNYGT